MDNNGVQWVADGNGKWGAMGCNGKEMGCRNGQLWGVNGAAMGGGNGMEWARMVECGHVYMGSDG
jgi:hypothetical protein